MPAATSVEDGAAVSRDEDRSRTIIRGGRDWCDRDDRPISIFKFGALAHAKRPAPRTDTSLSVSDQAEPKLRPLGG
ncbi:hypothetical protein ASD12_23510 [Mesorhizobium sp. Root102]|nr:hypothetical protein ASD12_23510 [Mesorhizobium sp. Root102]